MNRQNYKKQRKLEKQMNNLMRQLCCWNCFQLGHKRFQCPFPKQNSCSFCRKPSILSTECGCALSRQNVSLYNRRQQFAERIPTYDNDVLVPVVNNENGAVEYKRNDNLVIVVSNNENEETENDEDILIIDADTNSLNEFN